ncbi:MAG: HlyD family secretion protein [Deltaproteobacteria bacterium]|nr:HlyD family secretion protein [Deltaproteobacteria bacterium]
MEAAKEKPNNNRKKKLAFGLLAIVIAAGVASVYAYTAYKKTHIGTDDAFVEGRIHIVASKVPGTVKSLAVQDNQFVKQGDPLLEIEDQDYEVRVREAESALNVEKAKIGEIRARIDVAKRQLKEMPFRIAAARAHLHVQEANLKQADADLQRARVLFGKAILTEEKMEKAQTVFDVAAAQVLAAREQLKQAEAAQATQQAAIVQAEATLLSQENVIRQKEAQVKESRLKHSYTKILAPADGYIAKRSVEVGNQIQAGQPLMAIVPLDDVWIVANYKETQLGKVKPGQRVRIEVDSYPGRVFEGRVESIMAGTGAVFSLFPPENATGNYVKVVQRIPVKIVLEGKTDPDYILRIGMSVQPTILTGTADAGR